MSIYVCVCVCLSYPDNSWADVCVQATGSQKQCSQLHGSVGRGDWESTGSGRVGGVCGSLYPLHLSSGEVAAGRWQQQQVPSRVLLPGRLGEQNSFSRFSLLFICDGRAHCRSPGGWKRASEPLELQAIVSWEPNLGLLQGQQVFLTTEPPPQPHLFCFSSCVAVPWHL